jgi:hypothetical protein
MAIFLRFHGAQIAREIVFAADSASAIQPLDD